VVTTISFTPKPETVEDYGKMTAADLSIGYFVSALIPLLAIRNSFASFSNHLLRSIQDAHQM
jgi:hypothetical protein